MSKQRELSQPTGKVQKWSVERRYTSGNVSHVGKFPGVTFYEARAAAAVAWKVDPTSIRLAGQRRGGA